MIYRGNKIELDGMKFDSKVEAQFYQRFIKPSGKRFLFHPSALLYERYKNHGVFMRAKGYTPDFVIQSDSGEWLHIYDVKSSLKPNGMTRDARERIEFYQHQTGNIVELVVPRTYDFKMAILGLSSNSVLDKHAKRDRHGNVKHYKRTGNVQYDHYNVYHSINYDIRDIVGSK